jgi:hypothetical protein
MPEDAALAAGPRPLLSVLRGEPTPEELAAVIVVLTARSSGTDRAPARQRPGSAWTAKSRMLRPPLTAAPGAWRASGLPR